jgi:hypothetical protein
MRDVFAAAKRAFCSRRTIAFSWLTLVVASLLLVLARRVVWLSPKSLKMFLIALTDAPPRQSTNLLLAIFYA